MNVKAAMPKASDSPGFEVKSDSTTIINFGVSKIQYFPVEAYPTPHHRKKYLFANGNPHTNYISALTLQPKHMNF